MSVRTRFGVIVYYFIGVFFSVYQLGLVDAAEGGAPPGGQEEPPRREPPSPLVSADVEPCPLLQEAAENLRQRVLTGHIRQQLDSSLELRDFVARFFELLDAYYYRVHGIFWPETVYVSFHRNAREGRLRQMLDDAQTRAMAAMYLEVAAGDMGAGCHMWNSEQRTLGKRSFRNTLRLLRKMAADGQICDYLELPEHQYLFFMFYLSFLKRHATRDLLLFDKLVTQKLTSGQLAAVLQDRRGCDALVEHLKVGNSVLTSGGVDFPPEPPFVHKAFGPQERAPEGTEPPPAVEGGDGWVPKSPSLLCPGAPLESHVPTETSESASTSSGTETMMPSLQRGSPPAGVPSGSAPDPTPASASVGRGRADRDREGSFALARTRPLSALESPVPAKHPSTGPEGRRCPSSAHPSGRARRQPEPSAPPEHEDLSPPKRPVTSAAQFFTFPSASGDFGGGYRPPPYNPGFMNPTTAFSIQPVESPPPYPGETRRLPYPVEAPPPYPLYSEPPPPYTRHPEPTATRSQTAERRDRHVRERSGLASGPSSSQAPSALPGSSARGKPPTGGAREEATPSGMFERFGRLALGARPKTSGSKKQS